MSVSGRARPIAGTLGRGDKFAEGSRFWRSNARVCRVGSEGNGWGLVSSSKLWSFDSLVVRPGHPEFAIVDGNAGA
jgi:hypothetical protein